MGENEKTEELRSEKKKPDRLRNKTIRTWLSDDEYKILQDKCSYTGLSTSAYIREMIVKGAIIHYEPFEIKEVVTEINRIGNNINQIAKKINERNFAIEIDIEDLKNQYEELFNLYLDKVMGEN